MTLTDKAEHCKEVVSLKCLKISCLLKEHTVIFKYFSTRREEY